MSNIISYARESVDFGNGWFVSSLIVPFVQFFVSFCYLRSISYIYDFLIRAIFTLLVVIVLIIEVALFIIMLREMAFFYWGFAVSIFVPTLLFYISVFFSLINLIIAARRNGIFARYPSKKVRTLFICVANIKLSFALAYASPAGILVSIITYALLFLQLSLWPHLGYDKKDE